MQELQVEISLREDQAKLLEQQMAAAISKAEAVQGDFRKEIGELKAQIVDHTVSEGDLRQEIEGLEAKVLDYSRTASEGEDKARAKGAGLVLSDITHIGVRQRDGSLLVSKKLMSELVAEYCAEC